jgi:PiT family inorganic phosphate transporter
MDDLTLVAVVVVALFFDFTNGFHDTANSIATTVSTRALSPRLASHVGRPQLRRRFVSFKVAATIASGLVDSEAITLQIVMAGLVGAITWNLITWYVGLPRARATRSSAGSSARRSPPPASTSSTGHGLVDKVLSRPSSRRSSASSLPRRSCSRSCGSSGGGTRDRQRVFRRLQLVSGGFVAFTHGTNDAQKTMGIICLALVVSGHLNEDFSRPPNWVIFSAATAMALGTYAGGWRIIKTLGTRIAKLDPPQGFAAQTSCASILWVTAHYGFPVSTTHTISGSVLGAGATRRLSAVRWGVAGNILVAWVMTIPCAGLVGAGMEVLTRLPGGTALVFVLTGLIAAAAFLGRSFQGAGSLPPSRSA